MNEYRNVNKKHALDNRPEFIALIKRRAEEMANLVVRGREAGIKIGFIDPVKDDQDKVNPHTGCIQGFVNSGLREYDAEREKLSGDFNRARGVEGTKVPLEDTEKFIQFAEKNKGQYARFFELRKTYIDWAQQRVSGVNKTMAQLIIRQTHGERFYLAVGTTHTEGADSIPAYLEAIGYQPRITAINSTRKEAYAHYKILATKEARWLEETDFTNGPDSVLLLSGANNKPEFYTVPPELISKAKQVTIEGGYANQMASLPEPLNIDSATLVAPNGVFAKSLSCHAPRQLKR